MKLPSLPQKSIPFVLLVTKTHLVWAGGELKDPVLMEISQGVIHDLEIVNANGLENSIKSWMEQYRIMPGEIFLVFSSDVIYSQVFEAGTADAQQQYLSMLPFDVPIAKIIPDTTKVTLVAVSHELVIPLVRILELLGFKVVAAYPDTLFGNPIAAIEQFNNQTAQTYTQKPESYVNQSFYTPSKQSANMGSIRHSDGRIFTPKLLAMLGLFVVLISILIALLYFNGYLGGRSDQPSTPAIPVEPVTEELVPTPIVTLAASPPVATASTEINSNYQVEIAVAGGVENNADTIVNQFIAAGFVVSTSATQESSINTSVLVHPQVPVAIRTQIVDILQTQFSGVSTLENSAQEPSSIRITLGN